MLKKLAVISAVILVGGYVFLRAGGARSIMPSTKSGRIVNEADDRVLLPGSKSSAPFTSEAKSDVEPPATARTMMSGSKSLAPLIKSEDLEPTGATQPTTNPSK